MTITARTTVTRLGRLIGVALLATATACSPNAEVTDGRPDVRLQSGEQTVLFSAAGLRSITADDHKVLYAGGMVGIVSVVPGTDKPVPIVRDPVSTLAAAPDGTLYFVGIDNATKTLAPGAEAAQPLPFGEMRRRSQIAAAPDGAVYLADNERGALLKLQPGADRPAEVPVDNLGAVGVLAVDADNNLYAASSGQIVKIADGTDTAEPVLGATENVGGLAVDAAGNLYATDVAEGTVSRMPADGGDWVELPFRDLQSPTGIAVDGEGNVFVVAAQSNVGPQVIRLAAT